MADQPPVLNRDTDVPVMCLFCDDDEELLLMLSCLLYRGGFPFEGTFSSSPFEEVDDLVRKKVLNQLPPPPRGLNGLAFAGVGSSSAMSMLILIPGPRFWGFGTSAPLV
eukprot:evm.model.NODE_25904_length_47336_cov_19.557947.10